MSIMMMPLYMMHGSNSYKVHIVVAHQLHTDEQQPSYKLELSFWLILFLGILGHFDDIVVWSDGGSKHFKNSTMIGNYIKMEAEFQVLFDHGFWSLTWIAEEDPC